MITGIESFKEWFKENKQQYTIIGGTACDILMSHEGLEFRATKDIDLVLIIEAIDANFGKKFWEYVKRVDISIVIKVQVFLSSTASLIPLQINSHL